jgi:hypothetical protein
MKVWSKGLGRVELVLDFGKYRVERGKEKERDRFHIKGVITEPVVWDFRITMTTEDVRGLFRIAFNRHMLIMVLKGILLMIGCTFKRFFLGRRAADETRA